MTQVVLLHAFPVNRHLWDAQVEYLTKAGFKVTAPDIAGFGESRIPQDPSMALMAEQVLSHADCEIVSDELGLSRTVLSLSRHREQTADHGTHDHGVRRMHGTPLSRPSQAVAPDYQTPVCGNLRSEINFPQTPGALHDQEPTRGL